MDIDDLLDINFFEDAQQLLSQYNAPELLMFGFNVVDNEKLEVVQIADKYISSREELSSCYMQDFLWCVMVVAFYGINFINAL